MPAPSIVIARRFCGPPRSGNGGYVCGRLAAFIPGPASVRLKAPPPLETELIVLPSGSNVLLLHGSDVIAEARPAAVTLVPPDAPSLADASEATRRYAGFTRHVFPSCFVCGPNRAEGDGLRIFPGPVAGREIVAAPWTPDASLANGSGHVGAEFLWAALDCTSAFAHPQPPQDKAVVLGELAVRIDRTIVPGERCILCAWPIGIDGRKRFAGSVVFSNDHPVAVGAATWIEVDASAFGGL